MPWKEVTNMSLKIEFIRLAKMELEPFSHLCKRFNISRKTGYKILRRHENESDDGLKPRSRRPHSSPSRTSELIERMVVELRQKRPGWGGRKIHRFLSNKSIANLPTATTITDILHRHGLIIKRDIPEKAFQRYEHEESNDLWQIDFKGHFAMHRGRCHPLTVLDDHSRFSLGLKACAKEDSVIVQQHFIDIFHEYGLPYRMNFDNGTPWASVNSRFYRYTELTFWLIRLGIQVSFSRIRRPQTNGKLERFHRTLKHELLQYCYFWNLNDAQASFDKWRFEYNYERPHEGIDLKIPIDRYKPSTRQYPLNLPKIEYRTSDIVRNVNQAGVISYKNEKIFIGEALKYLPVGLREIDEDIFDIYFCNQKLLSFDLKSY